MRPAADRPGSGGPGAHTPLDRPSSRPALERLDALAPNRFHARLVLTCGLALLAASASGLQPGPAVVGLTVAVALGLGGVAGGLAADRGGRRLVVLEGAVLALLGSLLGVALPAAAVAGTVGCGMLLAAAVTLVAESSPVAGRATLVLALAPFVAAGPLLPPWAGAVPALAAIALWRGLPESPRWLHAGGRAVEADAVVRRAERAAGAPAITLAQVAPVAPTEARASDLAHGGVPALLLAALLAYAAGGGAAAHLGLAVALSFAALLVWAEGAGTPRRATAAGLGAALVAAGSLGGSALGPAAMATMLALAALAFAIALRPARGRPLEAAGPRKDPA